MTRSKLHLVDLAGSERVHKTSSTGQVYIFELEISSIYISFSFSPQPCVSDPKRGQIHQHLSKLEYRRRWLATRNESNVE